MMWKQKKDGPNKLSRTQFHQGISSSTFPSESWEVDLIFDNLRRGNTIFHADFINALKGREAKTDHGDPLTQEDIKRLLGNR